MLTKLRTFVTPSIAAVLIAGGVIFTVLALYAPADIRQELIGANGIVWTVVAYALRSPLAAPDNGGEP